MTPDAPRTWVREDCDCPVLDAHGDACPMSADATASPHFCDHCSAHAATPADSLDALRAALEHWVPQHTSSCAGQDEDADCICGTTEVYRAALRVAVERYRVSPLPPEPADPEPIKNETASGYARRLALVDAARSAPDALRAAAALLCGYMGHDGPCEAHLAFARDHYGAGS